MHRPVRAALLRPPECPCGRRWRSAVQTPGNRCPRREGRATPAARGGWSGPPTLTEVPDSERSGTTTHIHKPSKPLLLPRQLGLSLDRCAFDCTKHRRRIWRTVKQRAPGGRQIRNVFKCCDCCSECLGHIIGWSPCGSTCCPQADVWNCCRLCRFALVSSIVRCRSMPCAI